MTSKRCTKCGHELPLDSFWPRKERPGSYTSWCKPCSYSADRKKYHSPDEQERRDALRNARAAKAEQAANEAFNGWRGAEPGHIFARAW